VRVRRGSKRGHNNNNTGQTQDKQQKQQQAHDSGDEESPGPSHSARFETLWFRVDLGGERQFWISNLLHAAGESYLSLSLSLYPPPSSLFILFVEIVVSDLCTRNYTKSDQPC
jgi:hypothetical protein